MRLSEALKDLSNMTARFLFLGCLITANVLMGADPEKPARPAAKSAARPAGIAGPQGGVAAFERVLTPEQRQKLREATQANAGQIRASQEEALKLRRELQDAVLNGQAGEGMIESKSQAIAKLEAEALAARMKALAAVAGTLTAEQKEKIKETSASTRPARPGLGAGSRNPDAPRLNREPAAPPPPAK
jgi:Spy/CpxP family protein refolding chaperone